ncbi:TPA: D-xylose ABC transporter ATP-binding protein [Candidatus Sumerlaeota bacterium]|jgi:ABC-type sugar transport system ATPase subunit|nr:D-xylose ABC transporter ATP-binding protein [Candidatus Sumerlaeota bacterium]
MPPLIQFKNIAKRFPGVVALDCINLDIQKGACHALMGENGAGKSTLGKILAGIYQPSEGEILIDGKPVHFDGPADALVAGIGMIHQEIAFCENMSIAENLCLGDLPARGTFVNRKALYAEAEKRLASIGATFDVRRPLGELPIAQQQVVQIAAAVGSGAHILVFDEPTSSLSQTESENLFQLIEKLGKQGVTSIYVSHRLEELFRLCCTMTVLRDGKVAGTKPTSEMDERTLIEMMIGRPFEAYFPKHLDTAPGAELLRVENLSSPGKFENISFTVRAGEIVGMSGLVGAGRSEVAQALFGLDPNVTGKIFIRGVETPIGAPSQMMDRGLGLIPEDRKRHGLVLMMNARANISLPTLDRMASAGWVRPAQENGVAQQFFDRLRVRAPGLNTLAAGLSGGNQQKLVIAKWLAAKSNILLIDEPTRGVDVGAKAEIHALIDELARQGSAILLVSSELPEVINLSTRILVLRNGRIAGEVSREAASQENLMRLMAGIQS